MLSTRLPHAKLIFVLPADKDTSGFALKLQTRPKVTHVESRIIFMGRWGVHIFQCGLVKVPNTNIWLVDWGWWWSKTNFFYDFALCGNKESFTHALFSSSSKVKLKALNWAQRLFVLLFEIISFILSLMVFNEWINGWASLRSCDTLYTLLLLIITILMKFARCPPFWCYGSGHSNPNPLLLKIFFIWHASRLACRL